MSNLDVSICVVNWNGGELLPRLLASIDAGRGSLATETIVVDNGSTDGSVDQLPDDVQLIRNAENVGFARANNQAVEVARGRLLLFLNNDTELRPGALQTLVAHLDENPDVVAAGARLVWPDGEVQASTGKAPTLAALLHRIRLLRWTGRFSAAYTTYRRSHRDETGAVERLAGAALLVRANALKDTLERPLWDPEFPFGLEDVDLSVRLAAKGELHHVVDSEVVHHGSVSSDANAGFVLASYEAGFARFLAKHDPRPWASWIYRLLVALDVPLRLLLETLQLLVGLARRDRRKLTLSAGRLDGHLRYGWPTLAAILALALLLPLGNRALAPGGETKGDTRFYRDGARRFAAGEHLYYLDPPHRPGVYNPVTAYTYLPPFAAASVWMPALPYPVVRIVWLALMAACAGVAVWLSGRVVSARGPPLRHPALVTALATLLALRFGVNDLAHGQVNWLVTLLLAVTLLRGRGLLAGAALGLALVIKPTAWLLVPYYLFARRWRLAGACVATGLAALGLCGLRYGAAYPDLLLDWFRLMSTFAFDAASSPGNASLTGGLVMVLSGEFDPHTQQVTPALFALDRETANTYARAVTCLVVCSAFAFLVWKRRESPAAPAAVLLLSALLSPVTWKAHLVFLVLPGVFLARRLLEGRLGRGGVALLALAVALLVLPSRGMLGLDVLERLGSLTVGLLLLTGLLLRTPATETRPGSEPPAPESPPA